MTEEWKDIPGYERHYQASTYGRIKSVPRIVNTGSASRKIKECILTPFLCASGYMSVNFVYGGRKQFLVHRLIALTFLGQIDGKRYVNHKDFNRQNNSVVNLEWCNVQENIDHSCIGERNGRLVLNTETGIYYYTIIEAAKSLNISKYRMFKMMSGETINKTAFVYA